MLHNCFSRIITAAPHWLRLVRFFVYPDHVAIFFFIKVIDTYQRRIRTANQEGEALVNFFGCLIVT